jgi:hypothetical protein
MGIAGGSPLRKKESDRKIADFRNFNIFLFKWYLN